jgi:PBP1b-binding outer membrane lipoprotein LpoB
MKKSILALLLISVLVLAGCFSDPVQDDLLNYINKETTSAAQFEDKAISTYGSVSGVNYQDDQTLYDALVNEIIPDYTKFIEELESVNIETDELKEIHDIYLTGANHQFNGFLKIVEALEHQDIGMIEEANKMLDEGKKNISEYLDKLNELAEDHNVEIEKK